MALRLKDLSPAARAQVEAQLGTTPKRGRQRGEVTEPGLPIRCGGPDGCGQEFASYTGVKGWEAHGKATGHHRADIIINRAADSRDHG